MKGLAATFLVAVISMVTGCAASHPPPVTPVDADPWTDFHDGRAPTPSPSPVVAAKIDAPAPAEKSEKGKTDSAKSDGNAMVAEKTVASADTADETAPKPAKKKKGAKANRRASQASENALARKKSRKRSTKVVAAPAPDT